MSPPPVTLPVIGGRVSLIDALFSPEFGDRDVIQQLSYPHKKLELVVYLHKHIPQIIETVSRHLNVPQHDLAVRKDLVGWIFGGFNVVVPVEVSGYHGHRLPKRVLIRFALPYKVGESFRPGNVEEKVRCEAATYIWLQRNCPTIPIPRLYGVGLPGKHSFTACDRESIWHRSIWYWQCAKAWFRGSTLPPYFAHGRTSLLEVGYLVLEYVDDGKMLSKSWDENRHDPVRRANLFKGLSRTMLTLAKIPHPRIGSFTMDNHGVVSLTNRPLEFLLHELENHNIPTNIPRDLTYTRPEPYVLDMLDCHASRMRCQPNSIHSLEDGENQLAALTTMRSLLPKCIDRWTQPDDFILSLTDLHQNNILVDEDWNIVRIIDLEWACVLPAQLLRVPYWLTDRGVDNIYDEHLEEYKTKYDELVSVLEQEESIGNHGNKCSQLLKACWSTGSMWYSLALCAPEAVSNVIKIHFDKFGNGGREAKQALMRLWDEDAEEFVKKKVEDQKAYRYAVRDIFQAADRARREEEAEEVKAIEVAKLDGEVGGSDHISADEGNETGKGNETERTAQAEGQNGARGEAEIMEGEIQRQGEVEQ